VVRRIKRTLSGLRRVWKYVWSAEDRLTGVETADGEHWQYSYDPLGRRIGKRRLGADGSVAEEVLFVWDGEQLAEELRSDGSARTWDYEPDSHTPVVQIDRTPTQDEYDRRFHAIVTDIVGTPTDLVSDDGEYAWQRERTLWGRSVHTAETPTAGIDCPIRFPGQYADRENGWHYNFHRYYDPHTAQYVSPDPLGLVPADNDRSYVRNPLSWLDALGLAPCKKALLLKAWRLRNNQGGYSVYHGFDAAGNKIYAGITNNMARREAQHIAKNYGISYLAEVPGATNLKKWQARAVEQVLIEQVRASGLSRVKNGVPISQINSISPKRAIYGTAVRYGSMFLANNP
jgi:RHS repeat-associated protein